MVNVSADVGMKNQRKAGRRLDAIVFRNFYCSHITIKRRQQNFNTAAATGGGKDGDPWVTILRDRPLMEDPHHEDDAQYWHVVTADEFDRDEFDPESIAPLRSASMFCFTQEFRSRGLVRFLNSVFY